MYTTLLLRCFSIALLAFLSAISVEIFITSAISNVHAAVVVAAASVGCRLKAGGLVAWLAVIWGVRWGAGRLIK